MDKPGRPTILIGSILQERNRWRPGKVPTYRVSDWRGAWAEAGFDGVELWENHAVLAEAGEQASLSGPGLATGVFNSYAALDRTAAAEAARGAAAAWCGRLGAWGMKFNFGPERSHADAYVASARDWLAALPAGTKLLCECHAGTIAEAPAQAAELLAAVGPLDRVGAIVHGIDDPAKLDAWIDHLGPARVTHCHIQMVEPVDADDSAVKRSLRALLRAGYHGSYTLEFTTGARDGAADMDRLWREARRDLGRLREALAGG